MAVQASSDNITQPFLRYQNPAYMRVDAVLEQDAGRGATAFAPYTVMGYKGYSVPTTGTADGGNTGDGTVTAVATADGPSLQIGTYELECTVAATNGGTFKLTNPDTEIIANDLVMTAGAGVATTFIAGGLTFIITDGATDFIVTDKFTIAVAAVGKYVPLDPAAEDGSQVVTAIYMGDSITGAAIVAGDISNLPILVGSAAYDKNQLVIETGSLDTVLPSGKSIQQELAGLNLFDADTVDITGYENA